MPPAKLFNRNFVLLFQGQFVSQLGTSIYMIALLFWVKHATESATLMGLLAMTAMIPGVLLGPLGGTMADRWSRKLIIVLGDVANGVLIITIAALMFLTPEATELIITLLFIEAAVGGVVMAAFRPAISAAIPDLVPESKIEAANGLYQSSFQVSMLIGQSIGGLLFRVLGAPLVMLIDGITYLFSALSESFIELPHRPKARAPGWRSAWREFLDETAEGLRYLRDMRGLKDLFLVVAFANFFMAPFGVLLPFFVEDTLGVRADWFGYIIASMALGSILGNLLVSVVSIPLAHKGKFVAFALAAQGLFFIAFAYSGSAPLAMLILGAAGLLGGLTNVLIISVIQRSTPSGIRGRVFGLLTTLSAGLAPLSMGLAGVVADALDRDIPLIYAASGVCVMLLVPFLLASRDFHELMAFESTADAEAPPDAAAPPPGPL